MAAPIADQAGLSQRMRHDRHAGAAHAQQLGHELLAQQEAVAAEHVAGMQEPPRQPLVQGVRGVASGGLLSLRENELLVADNGLAELLGTWPARNSGDAGVASASPAPRPEAHATPNCQTFIKQSSCIYFFKNKSLEKTLGEG